MGPRRASISLAFCALVSRVDTGVEDRDVGQIPILTRVIKPESDDEFVRNREANLVYLDLDSIWLVLLQQRYDRDVGGVAPLEVIQQILQGEPAVDDILDHDDPPPLDLL